MKVAETSHTYNHPWNLVTIASWCKYPHPNAQHVIAVDTAERVVDAETGVLSSTRVLTCTSIVPGWMQSMFSLNKYAHAIEESIVDPVEKVYVLRSVNYSFSNLVRIEEKCTYTPDPEAPETRTKFTQEFQVKAYPMGVRSRMESTVLSNLTANSGRGRETLESVVQTIRENVAAASSASAEAAAMGAQAFAVSPAFPASSSFPSSRIGLAAIANPPKSEQ